MMGVATILLSGALLLHRRWLKEMETALGEAQREITFLRLILWKDGHTLGDINDLREKGGIDGVAERGCMTCICRACKKEYEEGKSTADWKGYCSQKCVHTKSKQFGYGRGMHSSEGALLKRVGEIGSVPK